MTTRSNRLKKNSAIAVVAVGLIGSFEGLQVKAYPDPATRGHPWTVCYGETKGVKKGDQYTVAECKAMLVESLQGYANGLERCLTAPVTDRRYVALLSFSYNVGTRAACNSSPVRLINAGHTKAGCDALLKWNRAAGIVFRGLTRRREAERAMCLEGL